MKKTTRWIFLFTTMLALVGISTIFVNVPMAASMQITPSPVFPVLPTFTPDALAASGDAEGAVCGQTGEMIILLLGESSPQEVPPRGADAIRVVRIDFDNRAIRVLSFPPDVFVVTPDLAVSRGIASTTLSQVYYQGKLISSGAERDKMVSATRLVAQTLANNFGIIPTQYVTVKQPAVKEFVDAMGGLAINIPADLDTGSRTFKKFKAGYQVLSGQDVLDYVRALDAPNSTIHNEYTRLGRQDQVIMLMFAQLSRPETMLRLPDLVNTFYKQVVTDFSLNQALDMACVLEDLSFTLRYLEIGPDLVSRNNQLLVPKIDAVITFLQDEFYP